MGHRVLLGLVILGLVGGSALAKWQAGVFKKKDGTSYHGTLVSLKSGSLTINLGKSKKTFKIPNGTTVEVYRSGKRSVATAPGGLTGIGKGTRINVGVDTTGRILAVAVNPP